MNEIKKLRKEFNDRLDALEKKQNIDWIDKILKHLQNKLLYDDYLVVVAFISDITRRDEIINYKKYSGKSILTWIIQAVADILNEGRDLSKWIEFYKSKKLNFIYKSEILEELYCIGSIKFHPDIINQAQSILENLNGINMLKMYFEVDNEE